MAEPEKTITLNAEEFERVYEIAVQKGMRKFTPGEARALESVRAQADAQLKDSELIEVLDDIGEILASGGFENLKQVADATDEELLAVKGIGPKALEQIRETLFEVMPEGGGEDGD